MLVAFNLRTPITSLPTVVTDIEATTGLGKAGLGALTTMPILMMGALAFTVPSLSARIGLTRLVWIATGILAIASGIRLAGANVLVLYASALLAGAAIALAGGCVPAIVRQQLPHRIGSVTGAWTTTMMIGAALAAMFTVPFEQRFGSWQVALAMWAIPAAGAWLVWSVVERRERLAPPIARRASGIRDLPWRSSTAWAITGFLAINSITFYTTVAWLAPSLEARGMSQADAGAAFGLSSAVGFIAALLLPPLLQRTRFPRALLAVVVLVDLVSFAGIAFAPFMATALWMVLFGLTNSGWFAMGQALIGMLSTDAVHAARLTAMVYAGMYLLAAIGPISAGILLDLTGSWTALFALISASTVLALIAVPKLTPTRR